MFDSVYSGRMKRAFFVAILMLLGSTAFAAEVVPPVAQKPYPLRKPEQLSRAGECNGGKNVYIPAQPNYRLVRTSTGIANYTSDRGMLVKWGSVVTTYCAADVLFCFVQDQANATTSTVGYLTDASSTSGRTEGTGGCYLSPATQWRDNVPFQSSFMAGGSMLSQRNKKCSSTTEAIQRAIGGYPCDAVADCGYGPATESCSAGTPAGAYLLAINPSTSAATECWVCIDR